MSVLPGIEVSPAAARSESPAAPLRFSAREFSGSLGDLGTFLPLAAALAVTCGMDLGLIFIFAGLANIASGWLFRQPIAVQPMKAIAAVAIAEGLVPGQIAAAGLLMGAFMFALAISGTVDAVVRRVPRPVVRGIQAGVGVKLAFTGVTWLAGPALLDASFVAALPAWGADSLAVAAVAAALLLWPRLRRTPVLPLIFLVGLVLAAIASPAILDQVRPRWPTFHFIWPSADQWADGLWRGALPQLPLTLLNSVVALCALSADYFPGRAVQPRRIAASVGLINLLCVPLGAMPMCHGSGGLAAQYRFGARTGGSAIMLGLLKVAAGLVFGSALVGVIQVYPRSILAVLLIFAGFALARPARDSLRGRALVIVLVTAALILIFNTAVGAAAGLAVAVAPGLWTRLRRSTR